MNSHVIVEHKSIARQTPSRDSRRAGPNTVHASSDATLAPSLIDAVPRDDRLSGLLRAAVEQRTLGQPPNAPPAVAINGVAQQPVIQRKGESAELLTKLATPQIRPGPAVAVQKALVDKLDVEYADVFPGTLINLGGILIEEMPAQNDALIAGAELTALPLMKTGSSYRYISAGGLSRAAKIKELGFDRLVVENTLKTMIDSKQIDYLRLAGLPNDEWKILIELHYYRERDMSATGFHKDTLGETLFVNLNYHMDKQVIGPEIVVNPPSSPVHDLRIKDTLPQAFRDDLQATRANLGDPTEFQTGLVDPYGYVAFVDEAVHHATPFYGHRNVSRSDLEWYLQTQYPAAFQEASTAYPEYLARWAPWGFAGYVKKSISAADSNKWLAWMEILDDDNMGERFTRNDLKGTMTDGEFDDLLEAVGAYKAGERTEGRPAGFHTVSIPTSGPHPIRPTGKPPLKRQLSNPDFRKTLPPPPEVGEKRRFFRTWVRVVTKDMADELPRRLLAEAEAERRRELERAERAKVADDLRRSQLEATSTGK